jgi:hypothetical protein
VVPAPVPDTVGLIEAAARLELERVGRLDTVAGAIVVAVARDADRVAPERRAAVAEKLLKLLAQAVAGTKPAGPDPVGDIARARAARVAAAS